MNTMTSPEQKKMRFLIVIVSSVGILICPLLMTLVYTHGTVRLEIALPVVQKLALNVRCIQRHPLDTRLLHHGKLMVLVSSHLRSRHASFGHQWQD